VRGVGGRGIRHRALGEVAGGEEESFERRAGLAEGETVDDAGEPDFEFGAARANLEIPAGVTCEARFPKSVGDGGVAR
jgi:hypothetical protein